jgi:hypothetical protein
VPTFERLARFDREFRRSRRELQQPFLAMPPLFVAALKGVTRRLRGAPLLLAAAWVYAVDNSTRVKLLRRLGRTQKARDANRRELALVHHDAERRLLERRLATSAWPPARPAMTTGLCEAGVSLVGKGVRSSPQHLYGLHTESPDEGCV